MPSSLTTSSRLVPSQDRRTSARVARAWRCTLVRASCSTRKHAISVTGDAVGKPGSMVHDEVQARARRGLFDVPLDGGAETEIVEGDRAQRQGDVAHLLEDLVGDLQAVGHDARRIAGIAPQAQQVELQRR